MTETELTYLSGSVHDNVLVATILVEKIGDPDTSYALRDEILLLLNGSKTSHIVLDLQRVTFICSVGFLAFLSLRRQLDGGQIVICNSVESVRDMFEVFRLASQDPSVTAPFQVEDTLEAALARFSE